MSSVALHPAETFAERMRAAVIVECRRHTQREIAEVLECNPSNVSIALGRKDGEGMNVGNIARYLAAVEVLDARKVKLYGGDPS